MVDLETLLKISKIKVDNVESFQKTIEDTLKFIGTVMEVDVTGVEPYRKTWIRSVLREDLIESQDREQELKTEEGSYFRIRRII